MEEKVYKKLEASKKMVVIAVAQFCIVLSWTYLFVTLFARFANNTQNVFRIALSVVGLIACVVHLVLNIGLMLDRLDSVFDDLKHYLYLASRIENTDFDLVGETKRGKRDARE